MNVMCDTVIEPSPSTNHPDWNDTLTAAVAGVTSLDVFTSGARKLHQWAFKKKKKKKNYGRTIALYAVSFFFSFCANPSVNSVRIINSMIEDFLRMKMKNLSYMLVNTGHRFTIVTL